MGVGVPKALLEYENGKSFLGQLASVLTKAGAMPLVVVGASAGEVEENHPQLEMVRNEAWMDGQLSSARLGIRTALEMGAQTVVVQPVDMPFIRATTLTTLLKGFSDTDTQARIPTFEGANGHPLVLSREAAEHVLASSAATLELAMEGLEVRKVPVKDPAVLLDVNTPDVHQRLFERGPQVAPPPKRRMRSAPAEMSEGQ